jgi:DcmR-like sensory protein
MSSGRAVDLEPSVAGTLEAVTCPHMAIVLDTVEDVPSALASFYALGLRRNGWLFHRSLPGQGDADRRALSAAGLEVGTLEREGRLEVCELPVKDPPERWAQPWLPVVERQLERGFEAVWWSRFPVGPDDAHFERALTYDRYWEACFHGREAVSLCVYVVGGVAAEAREERVRSLREIHDATLVAPADGDVVALPRQA